MKDQVEEQGGYFACSFEVNGVRRPTVLMRAKSAQDARRRLGKMLGCVLAAFTATVVGP